VPAAGKSYAVSDWNAHDTALWHTCEIAVDLAAGRVPQALREVLAPFPPPAPDRAFWASGTFELMDLRAAGDGSYMRNDGFFFATGPLGLALTAAAAVGKAAGNSFQGQSEAGPISWILVSDWAELLFVTWALLFHPRHPQLLSGAWLPPGWLDRCAAHAYRTRLASPRLESSGRA